MNEDENIGRSDQPDSAPDPVDDQLSAAGAELRDSTPAVSGERVITDVLRRDLARARRRNSLVAGAASVLVVAVLAATLAGWGTNGDGTNPLGAGSGEVAGPGSAEAIVAELPPEPQDPRQVELVASTSRFDSCGALVDRLRSVGAAHVGSTGFGAGTGYRSNPANARMVGDATDTNAEASTGSSAGTGTETLGTNVIVAGVDEPDTVKATDTIVVELHGGEMRVIDTTIPAVVAALELGSPNSEEHPGISSSPSSLLLDGRRAVVFGTESVSSEPLPGDPSQTRPTVSYLTVTFVDLADAANPKITERVRIEGDLVAVRRVGGEIRLVTSSSLGDLPIVVPTTPNAVAPALEQNRLAVAGSAAGDWIPEWDRGEGTEPTPLVGCEQVVVPDTFAGVQMTSMVSFELTGPFEPRATGLLAPAEDLTATATDVVVASHVWVDPIDQKDDFSDWRTALHRFRFADAAAPEYLGSGSVAGSINDDFSLAVLDGGVVGVVTADVLPWELREDADVTVRTLRTEDATQTLTETGSLVFAESGVAVSGVRFIGNRLLVTTGLGNVMTSIDLTDPEAPVAMGEVALPGAGTYFHPVDDTRVLVLGETTRQDDELWITGLHATVVDLAAQPRVVGTWAEEDTSASATHDHHAFTWWPSRSVAAFGIDHGLSDPQRLPAAPQALFLTVGDGAPVATKVTPAQAELGPRCPLSGEYDSTTCDSTGWPSVHRVLVVDGRPWLYTSESLEALDLRTYESTAVVALRP